MWDGMLTLVVETTVNALSILRNPMILLGLVSMVIIFGMPKLVENSTFPRFLFFRDKQLLTMSLYSGPGNARRMGREPEEEPYECSHGRWWCSRGFEL